ncbi:hypothetical protein [Streptomyces melanosporofaciens]|uniref:hypothetical protein n=1 Tax=Streptomyces melanosporofaciens TaxID=67327 RepID=UPI00116009D7|nr:hypothetical protein [Streptomyces melanosporofaciens]
MAWLPYGPPSASPGSGSPYPRPWRSRVSRSPGPQQKFSDGTTRWACRTFDSSNDPKWGVYGAENSRVVNYIDDLKVGTTRGDVD